MSEKIVEVDAIGNACPIPVVKTIKAIKGLEGAGVVVTKVDNETAVKNLAKLASDKGYTSEAKQLEDGNYEVTTTVSGTEASVDEADAQQFATSEKNVVVVVGADHQGEGDDELGRNLMKMFIYTLSQMDELPKTILFYNGGVRLTCERGLSRAGGPQAHGRRRRGDHLLRHLPQLLRPDGQACRGHRLQHVRHRPEAAGGQPHSPSVVRQGDAPFVSCQ